MGTPAAGSSSSSVPPRARVLLVEDDEMIQLLVSRGVEAEGCELEVVERLTDARRALDRTPFQAVILDLMLPDGDGRDLLVEIREQPESATLPIVVLSGRGGRDAQLECFRMGADEFFVKPFDPEILAAAVSRQLERGRLASGPTSHSSAPAPSSETPPSTDRPAPRVLIVEDEPTTSTLVRHRLEHDGMEVVHKADGTEALDLLTEESDGADFDVVLLDVKLPGVGGFEILQALRSRPGWKTVPVVMLTGMGQDEDIVRAFDLGANDYILKPFSPVELLARVRRLVRTG